MRCSAVGGFLVVHKSCSMQSVSEHSAVKAIKSQLQALLVPDSGRPARCDAMSCFCSIVPSLQYIVVTNGIMCHVTTSATMGLTTALA